MKFLLIDDSKLIASIMSEIMQKNKFEMIHAQNGQLGIETYKKHAPFDLVFLDWNMPVMDGPSFLLYNQQNNLVHCPIVMLTTENKPEFIQKAITLGVSEYVMKPFTEDIILSKIEMLIPKAG